MFKDDVNVIILLGASFMQIDISAGIFKQSMGARNRVGIGLSYRPAKLHSLAELVPWNRFLGFLKVLKFGFWWAGTSNRVVVTE